MIYSLSCEPLGFNTVSCCWLDLSVLHPGADQCMCNISKEIMFTDIVSPWLNRPVSLVFKYQLSCVWAVIDFLFHSITFGHCLAYLAYDEYRSSQKQTIFHNCF